jgi:hypothetical protein
MTAAGLARALLSHPEMTEKQWTSYATRNLPAVLSLVLRLTHDSPLLCGRFGEETDQNVRSGATWPRAATFEVRGRACARKLIKLVVAVLLGAGPAVASCYPWYEPFAAPMNWPAPPSGEPSSTPATVLSPQQALNTYEARALRQLTTLDAYSDKTTIEAEIPAMGEKGQCSLRRTFSAPQSLIYTAVEFLGDTFVKTSLLGSGLKAIL